MRLASIFLKDVKAFFRDFRSFTLLFLTPVMLVLLIGAAFVGATPSNINIVVCSVEENDISAYIDSSLNDNDIFLIERIRLDTVETCRAYIDDKILKSSVRAGVIIPARTEFYQTNVELIVDNSKLVSDYIKSYFEIVTNDISQKITKVYVDILFSNIDEVKRNLADIDSKLRAEKNSLTVIKEDLLTVKSSLNAVKGDLQAAYSSLSAARNSLDRSAADIDAAALNIESAVAVIGSAYSSVNALNISQAEKAALLGTLTNSMDSLRSTSLILSGAKSSLANSRAGISSAMNLVNPNSLDRPIQTVESVINVVDSAMRNVDLALDKLSVFRKLVEESNIEKPETVEFVDSKITNFFVSNKFIDFLFPTTVMAVVMIMSTFLASITFIRQKSTGLLQRILIAPGGMKLLLIERVLLITFLSIITLPIIIIAGVLFLGIVTTPINILILFVSAAVTSIIFASIGLIIATISKYESTAILLSIFITLPMIFLSGILIPLERLPDYIAAVTAGMPLNMSIRIYEGFAFYSADSATFFVLILSIVSYFIVSSVISWQAIKRELSR